MMPMLVREQKTDGFALPTVILASVIMLIVLTVSVTAVGSVTTALAGQYYTQLAREAAESGLAHARACLRASPNYTATWTNALPLKPNTDCSGATLGSVSQWVATPTNARSTYTVPAPTTGSAGYVRVAATATVELTRASNPSQVWRTYTFVGAENSRYNDTPQIAGGAGWKENWHNGYMLAGNGTLYGWGDNSAQQLGPPSVGTITSTPIKITPPDGVQYIRRVFNSGQGASILCILAVHSMLGDQLYCRGVGVHLPAGLGWQRFGIPAGLTVTDAVVNGYGEDAVCALASDQQAYCAGENYSGNLGNATTTGGFVAYGSPEKFRLDLASPGPVSGSAASLTVKKVFSQDRFSCVIASDDQAYCAGDNNYAQLGQGNFTTNIWVGKSTPGRALIPGNPPVTDIIMPYHSTAGGIFFHVNDAPWATVYMSGHNGSGTSNDGGGSGNCPVDANVNCYPIPRALTTGTFGKVISIGEEGADGRHGICVIASDRSPPDSGVWCMGNNNFGQLGTGSCAAKVPWFYGMLDLLGETATPTMNRESTYQMNSAMFITTAGSVFSTGDNRYGKLGRNAPLQACNPTPAKVLLPAGVKATALANTDEYTTFILGDNGKVYAMGRNHQGQLGDGTTIDRNAPVEVKIPRQEVIY